MSGLQRYQSGCFSSRGWSSCRAFPSRSAASFPHISHEQVSVIPYIWYEKADETGNFDGNRRLGSRPARGFERKAGDRKSIREILRRPEAANDGEGVDRGAFDHAPSAEGNSYRPRTARERHVRQRGAGGTLGEGGSVENGEAPLPRYGESDRAAVQACKTGTRIYRNTEGNPDIFLLLGRGGLVQQVQATLRGLRHGHEVSSDGEGLLHIRRASGARIKGRRAGEGAPPDCVSR